MTSAGGSDAELTALSRQLRELGRRLDRLEARADQAHARLGQQRQALAAQDAFLDAAPRAQELLDELTRRLFDQMFGDVESTLTQAIREILGQERQARTRRSVKDGRLAIEFYIESPDGDEDIRRGQGGSVCNIVSAGLRLIALSQLDPARHRPFLVLDEGDCWLKPDLVPRFMDLVARTARALGLQVLVISHHPMDLFALKADRILGLTPSRQHGVEVQTILEFGRKTQRKQREGTDAVGNVAGEGNEAPDAARGLPSAARGLHLISAMTSHEPEG
ncbi:P-loop NTPase family protein [Megalodesulfovibrio paquesii]